MPSMGAKYYHVLVGREYAGRFYHSFVAFGCCALGTKRGPGALAGLTLWVPVVFSGALFAGIGSGHRAFGSYF